MKPLENRFVLLVCLIFAPMISFAEDNPNTVSIQKGKMTETSVKQLLKKMSGNWEGRCRTWLRPGELADESDFAGRIESVMGNILRHTYSGSMNSKPRKGEELIGYDEIASQFRVSWFDDFHMSSTIMFSEGKAIENGFSVSGKYEVGKGLPAWSWRTEYQMKDDDHLTITAYNIHPDGREAKAVETKYQRKSPVVEK